MKRPLIYLGVTARTSEELIQISDLGLAFAEIPFSELDGKPAFRRACRDAKRDLGIFCLAHGPQEGDPNNQRTLQKRYQPQLLRILPRLPALSIQLLTVHFWVDPRFVTQRAILSKIDILRRITEEAAEQGIQICLENLSEQASHLAPLFESVPLLGLTLDLGHGQFLSPVHTGFEIMAQFADRIRHIHVHDNHGGRGPEDDLHLPPGQGKVPFLSLFHELREVGYHGTVTLELRIGEAQECLPRVKEMLLEAGYEVAPRALTQEEASASGSHDILRC